MESFANQLAALTADGYKMAEAQAKLFKFMKQQGFIGKGQYIKSCVIRSGSALAPNWLRKFMFEKVLRK